MWRLFLLCVGMPAARIGLEAWIKARNLPMTREAHGSMEADDYLTRSLLSKLKLLQQLFVLAH